MIDNLDLFIFGTFLMALIMVYPALAITNSSVFCLDNTTLIENITVYKDGNSSNLWQTMNCPFNCSNVTKSCNPPVYQQNVIIFIIIIIIVVAGWQFVKWVNR